MEAKLGMYLVLYKIDEVTDILGPGISLVYDYIPVNRANLSTPEGSAPKTEAVDNLPRGGPKVSVIFKN